MDWLTSSILRSTDDHLGAAGGVQGVHVAEVVTGADDEPMTACR